jgi:hypothetical protein
MTSNIAISIAVVDISSRLKYKIDKLSIELTTQGADRFHQSRVPSKINSVDRNPNFECEVTGNLEVLVSEFRSGSS